MRPRYQSLVWIASVLAVAGATSASARQPEDGTAADAPATVITNPEWAISPGPEYPERALYRGANSGSVDLDCGFTPEGAFSSCLIVKETPTGMGFGAAALAGARRARMAPGAYEGAAADARVRFTVQFHLRH